MPFRPSLAAAAAALALAAPSAAQAADTYRVDSGHPGCDTGFECRTIGEAAARAQPGDTILIAAGRYRESVALEDAGLTVRAPFGTQLIGTEADRPTLRLAGGEGPATTVRGLTVFHTVAGQPAIEVADVASVTLQEVIGVSTTGPVLRMRSGSNRLRRSALYAGAPTAHAVEVLSEGTSADAKALTVESSILSGGKDAAGLRAWSGAGAPASVAGDITVTLRHATVAGAAKAVIADAGDANGAIGTLLGPDDPAGNIAVTAADSILHGAIETETFGGDALHVPNSATVDTATRNDRSTAAGRLFVDPARRDFRLRADAPVVDRGGMSPGELDRDLQGEARVAGPASDLGADEFHNRAPVASLRVSDPRPREGRAVTLDATGSRDPEDFTGGGIVAYRWSFGDGTTRTTTSPLTTHVYARRGSYPIAVTPVDRQGAAAAQPARASVTVTDGVAPAVAVDHPTRGAKLKRATFRRKRVVTRRGGRRVVRTKRVRRAVPMRFTGTAADESGVRTVELALVLVKPARSRRTARTTAALDALRTGRVAADAPRCRWFDGKRATRVRSCSNPLWFKARLVGGQWAFRVRDARRLPPGQWILAARGTDATGMVGNGQPSRGLVRFTLRR